MTRDQTEKPEQMLLLRTFVEKHRADITGDDDGEGGLIIPCPFGAGTIVVRDARLLGHKPIIGGPRTTEEYVASLTKACPLADACYISESEVRDTSRQLHRAHFVDRLNPEHLRTANIDAFTWLAQHLEQDSARKKQAKLMEVLLINQRYAQVDQEGQILVFDDATGLSYRREEFCAKTKGKLAATKWLAHPARRCYDGVGLFPKNKTRFGTDYRKHPSTWRYYNLWQDFAFEPVAGDWSLLKEHIRLVLCRGNQEHFEYLLNWLAHVLQKPWEKPGVAVVVKGKKGTGKGIVANAFRDAIGRPLAVMLSNKEHVVGRFASSKARAIFAQVEEALYAGDPRIDGILKADITEPTATIELKFKNPVEIDSFTRYWFNSNERRAVPVSDDERRYFVLLVDESRMGDRAYFKRIIDEIESGGREAMLHELVHRDISTFEVRDVPWTDALGQEVLENLPEDAKAILEIVRSGRIVTYDKDNKETECYRLKSNAHTLVPKQIVYAALARAFRDYGQDRGFETKVGTTLSRYKLVDKSTDARGDHPARFRFRPLDDIRADLAERWGVPLSELAIEPGVPDTVYSLRLEAEELLARISRVAGNDHSSAAADAHCQEALKSAISAFDGSSKTRAQVMAD